MSSHNIHVICPSCHTSDMIYTGDTSLDAFDDCDWEGEIISTQCTACKAAGVQVPTEQPDPPAGLEELRQALLLFYNPTSEHHESPYSGGTWCRQCEEHWPCRQMVARMALSPALAVPQ
jgi:hypothetical protein